jgi:uncharacterized protein (TIGR02145 family)
MKTKILLSILTIGLMVIAFGQKPTMELTFTALNNEQYVPLDSIFIENLTQGGDITLIAPDTVLQLVYTNIGDNQVISDNGFSVSQNYPNPFKQQTQVNLFLSEKENIKIIVRDVLGRELAHYKNTLNQGNHTFTFYPGNAKYYFLIVTGEKTSKTIKMVNASSNLTFAPQCKIAYTAYHETSENYKSQEAINDFVFSLGDELKYSAYTDVEETEIIDSPAGSQIYTFQFDGWTPCAGPGTVTDIDGNTYNTVQIGNQCWMKENLKTTKYNNNTLIPNITDASSWSILTTGAYVCYDNDISWKHLYGALYNWYAVDDINGLCPTGWHVPEQDEWVALLNFIGGQLPPHGDELKSCRQVNSPLGGYCNATEHPRWEYYNSSIYGTDAYGFSGIPGGGRSYSGTFVQIGIRGYWWSSTEYLSDKGIFHFLSHDDAMVGEYFDFKQTGFSVRCLRDN